MLGFTAANSRPVVEKKINNSFRSPPYNIKIKHHPHNLGLVFHSFGCEFLGFVIIMGSVCLLNI